MAGIDLQNPIITKQKPAKVIIDTVGQDGCTTITPCEEDLQLKQAKPIRVTSTVAKPKGPDNCFAQDNCGSNVESPTFNVDFTQLNGPANYTTINDTHVNNEKHVSTTIKGEKTNYNYKKGSVTITHNHHYYPEVSDTGNGTTVATDKVNTIGANLYTGQLAFKDEAGVKKANKNYDYQAYMKEEVPFDNGGENRDRFGIFDGNGDGQLTVPQTNESVRAYNIYAHEYNLANPSAKKKAYVKMLDTDSNGKKLPVSQQNLSTQDLIDLANEGNWTTSNGDKEVSRRDIEKFGWSFGL